jgi:hypothetical protein
MTRPQSRYPMDSGLNVFGEDGAPQAGASPDAVPQPGSPREVRLAMLAYPGIPFTLCVLPLSSEFRPVPRWLRLTQQPPVSR